MERQREELDGHREEAKRQRDEVEGHREEVEGQ